MRRRDVCLAEVAALLALAQDHAFGQPAGSQLRSTVLGQRLAAAVGADRDEQEVTWWASALRFLGCTGHAHDTAVVFGDEIELRAASLVSDMSNPVAVMRMMIERAGPSRSGLGRLPSVLSVLAGGRKAAEMNFRAACEVADVFAERLDLDGAVRGALAATFERWNGRGLPAGARGTEIPRPMRVAHISQEFEVLARIEGVDGAFEILRRRRGKAYDPALVDLVVAEGASWWAEVEATDPWDAALSLAPTTAPLSGDAWNQTLLVLADFADLKSPWMSGHSRAVAELVARACGREAAAAALVHDIGCVAVSNTVWDKPAPFTRDERDRAETHALVTEQLLRRVPGMASLADVAAAAHERMDGSGYHRRAASAQLDAVQRTLAAADCYQAMVSDRPHRVALRPDAAAEELRSMSADGRLDGEAVERVLHAAGHERVARAPLPKGLTAREAEVLQLLALGLTNRQVGEQLGITPKTAGHHVQHIYSKIGVSTRGAATLFAIEHGILTTDA